MRTCEWYWRTLLTSILGTVTVALTGLIVVWILLFYGTCVLYLFHVCTNASKQDFFTFYKVEANPCTNSSTSDSASDFVFTWNIVAAVGFVGALLLTVVIGTVSHLVCRRPSS